MMIGSFRTRSISTPACSENNENGSASSATSVPIWAGVASSMITAVSGSASIVIWPPKLVTVDDSHISRKSRCASSPDRQ